MHNHNVVLAEHDLPGDRKPKIPVYGVGGGGVSAINRGDVPLLPIGNAGRMQRQERCVGSVTRIRWLVQSIPFVDVETIPASPKAIKRPSAKIT